jgi:AcrR family transcriptional regulator
MARTRLSREASREQTRQRLLAAARAVFAEQGVNGASVEEIATRAGYSRGAFYGNFQDKHDLVLALLKQRTEQEATDVAALGAAGGTFAGALEPLRAWHRDRAAHLNEWLALRLELWLYALGHDDVRTGLAERERFARNALAGGLAREFVAHGVSPPAALGFLALIAHALEDGLFIQRALTPDEVPPEAVVDAVDLLIRSWIALATAAPGQPDQPADPSERMDLDQPIAPTDPEDPS